MRNYTTNLPVTPNYITNLPLIRNYTKNLPNPVLDLNCCCYHPPSIFYIQPDSKWLFYAKQACKMIKKRKTEKPI